MGDKGGNGFKAQLERMSSRGQMNRCRNTDIPLRVKWALDRCSGSGKSLRSRMAVKTALTVDGMKIVVCQTMRHSAVSECLAEAVTDEPLRPRHDICVD